MYTRVSLLHSRRSDGGSGETLNGRNLKKSAINSWVSADQNKETFGVIPYLKNRIYNELVFLLARLGITGRYQKTSGKFDLSISLSEIRKICKKNNLYYDKAGMSSWWFSAYMIERNARDELTSSVLEYITTNISKDSNVLVSGCGTGWMLFWLMERGYVRMSGFDYLPNVVRAANELATLLRLQPKIWQDDGFNPKSELDRYDLILALHWLYTAWMGNYGNKPSDPGQSRELLRGFLATYVPHLSPGGTFIIELIDSIADFKVPPSNYYPVRHSQEQVAECAKESGLLIERKMFCGNYSFLQPRMVYIFRKAAN